jgi:hypothetical protein
MRQPKNYITTYKKHRFSPLNPLPDDIDIEDIAHALSLMCRANGHFTRFYSIARHCINCSDYADGSLALMLLLHDASEAYISDLTRPVKLGLPEYGVIEERLQAVIWERFGLSPTGADMRLIGEIDDMMLKLEFREFADEEIELNTITPVTLPDFSPKTFEEDEQDFLRIFLKYHSKRSSA